MYTLETSLLIAVAFLLFLNYKLRKREGDLQKTLDTREHDFAERETAINSHLIEFQSLINSNQKIFEETQSEYRINEISLKRKIDLLEEDLSLEKENRKKVLSQKKSGEVRLGHIAETLAPFLDQFDFKPDECSFLGQPIDYISFGEDKITFIEIKSGNSQLSKKQRRIRDLIKSKSIEWKEVRIK